eukprot:TRINITY_DN7344_c0_g1_i2.p2 TRINITY_DN7344_c0_g1~~TRINITY_DN7344_c0_g1_i2.p2  ORF type:complete len:111 (+),score=5.63 TRINITY_DN7344_c0_g1_i2:461-793(+)
MMGTALPIPTTVPPFCPLEVVILTNCSQPLTDMFVLSILRAPHRSSSCATVQQTTGRFHGSVSILVGLGGWWSLPASCLPSAGQPTELTFPWPSGSGRQRGAAGAYLQRP